MTDLVGFVALAIVVIVTPGPDTALTIRNTLVGGRPAGWRLRPASRSARPRGRSRRALASPRSWWRPSLRSGALKLAGAAYLIYLGAQSLWSAFRGRPTHPTVDGSVVRVRATTALRQGVLSNLTNPKMAVFFPSLLPQSSQRTLRRSSRSSHWESSSA